MDIDEIEASLGPAKEQFDFMVEEFIKSEVEIGIDGFFNGKEYLFPTMWGIESGKSAYIGKICEKKQDLPKQLKEVIENYFPHIWSDPKKAVDMMKRIMGKKPLSGTKSFLRHRTIESTKVGIDMGLTPVTYNPIDLALLKLREMDR